MFASGLVRRYSTIFALATAKGRAGVGIIRVSGNETKCIIESITKSRKTVEHPRRLHYSPFYCSTGNLLDRGMSVYFPGPNSFTGEDVAEFHIHSSSAVIEAFYMELANRLFLRLAEPGEFTRRAFDNGKLDLSQIEGLADLLAAETQSQAKLALHQLEGNTRRQFEGWRSQIIQSMAMVEAWIDFSEDENIESNTLANVNTRVENLRLELQKHLEASRIAEIGRTGFRIAICGPPNAGKSSLLNRLAKRDAAIVSPIAGTTRDTIQISLQIRGYPVILTDTAGIRSSLETFDPIELEGIERAHKAAMDADHVLYIVDSSVPRPDDDAIIPEGFDPQKMTLILNKSDLSSHRTDATRFYINCLSDEGIFPLLAHLDCLLTQATISAAENPDLPVIIQERHKQHVRQCIEHLEGYSYSINRDVVLAAQYLRYAAHSLGQITGIINPEEILDSLFSTFCIGK